MMGGRVRIAALVAMAVVHVLSAASCSSMYLAQPSNISVGTFDLRQTAGTTKAQDPEVLPDEKPNQTLVDRAYLVLGYIENEDYVSLAKTVHPEKGVTFTPFSTVDVKSDVCFTKTQVAGIADNKTVYIWGVYDGDGSPVSMTPVDYFKRFVYNFDYASVGVLGVNSVIKEGNSLENVREVYKDAQFVEFHSPGADPQYAGIDWCSLKLVFEVYNDKLMLTAVIHSEWTI